MIPIVLFWMVVAHNLDSENVDKILAEYFLNFVFFESDYISAKGEAIFFSKTTLVVTNGVKVHILEASWLAGWTGQKYSRMRTSDLVHCYLWGSDAIL